MRLINADALIDDVMNKPIEIQVYDGNTVVGVRRIRGEYLEHRISIQPTIDAVPVVRCHKCNYYNEKVNMCDYRDVEVYDGDFCSWGTEVIE